MSKRLLQRGRYPKGTGIENVTTTTNSQFPPTASGFPPPAAEFPFYGAPPPSQPPQNAWNTPLYTAPNIYDQNQIPNQPVPESSNHWTPGHMYSIPTQPSTTEQWNWKPESNEHTPYPNYQAPPQGIEQYPQIPCSVVDNQNYSQQQPVSYPQTQQGYPSDFQIANNNSNSVAQNPPLQAWENGTMNITQAEQLPWTYSTPQYTNSPQPDFPQNFNPVPTHPPSWNYTPEEVVQPEAHIHGGSINYLPNSGPAQDVDEQQQRDQNQIEQNTSTDQNEKISSVSLSEISSTNPNVNTSDNVESSNDAEYGTGTLSAFFQNNDPENSTNNSECDGPLTSENENVLDSCHLEEIESHQVVNESDKSSAPSELAEPDEETDDENQGNDFIQEEDLDVLSEDLASKSNSISPSGFVEEPINQEVPEPHVIESVNVKSISNNQAQQSLEEQDNLEVSPEEPLNQQIPSETGQKSRSTSSERERIVIRPREDSPFKPPRMNSNSKGTVVQQEVAVQNIAETKMPEPVKKTVAQVVNLETFPDNLERPPDYEELRKQSPLYVSHQKHLRKELNSSPSSLLCDNPDIPSVTFAPAAPPIHSSAKSDKSESSCDSKQETHSLDNPASLSAFMNGSKIQSSSPLNEEEYYAKLNTVNQSESNAPLPNVAKSYKNLDKKNKNNFPAESKQEISNYQQNNPGQPIMQGPLKDSKVNGSHMPHRPPEPLRRQPEHPETPSSSHSGSSRQDTDIARAQDPRGNPGGVDARQRFADYKYPSYDERHYYSDRERSRPDSRSSLGERPEDYMYQGKREDYMYPPGGERHRGPPEYPRPSSRTSETDMNRQGRSQYDYYRQPHPYSDPYQRRPDYYSRPPNYRGYDYDPYQRDPYYSQQYYDAYRYAYSNYNFGFYDELYRNDPRYKQYQEQYRQYYAKYGYGADYERSSVQSGRSSANELAQDVTPSQYVEPDIDSNESEFSTYNLQQDYSYSSVPNESSILAVDQSSTSSARLTPVKFSYAHPIACFTPNGLLITAIPSQATLAAPSAVRIQSLQMFVEEEESYQELKDYQGPLIRGLTHKNDVIEFCSQKIKSLKSKDVVDRDSHVLLWELMVLLLRQNGSVAGSDIAELLLKDHEVLRPISVPLKQAIETPQGDNSPADVNDSSSQSHAGDASSPDEGIVVLNDKNILNTSRNVDVDKITRKFREFLLFGHKKDALEWAMKHGLWGHALFLASKMDLRTYASVMTRFANSLALNDPLQTLYQLMSGRQPSAVTFVADKKWGDWRPHLAMILSNPSSHPDVDSRSITTLGDTLASRGCLPAAHFCYIMAQVEFGTFELKSSKLVLLSSDHRLPFEEFATNEAIQFTEIYEYAQSLATPGYMLTHLQMYKFLYALRLIEHGLLEEGLHYLEVISGNFHTHPSLFPLDLITEVLKLGTQLKYHDPYFMRGQGELEDQEDPEWLRNLAVLVQNYNNLIQGLDLQQQSDHQQQDISQSYSNEPQLQPQAPVDNVSYQNVSGQSLQNEMSGSMNHLNYYQHNSWNQQPPNVMPSNGNVPTNQQESVNYYQNEMGLYGNQSNFQMENSIPSHEENETTDVPSSPVTQTPPFDYYSGGTQQEWSSAHSLPSVSYSDVGIHNKCVKSDLEKLMQKEETESDVALCSSAHSTPLHNYLLSKDDSDDRRVLMTRSGHVDVRTLNSCLKSNHSHSNKHKKCIKFDSSVSGHQSKSLRNGLRRRRFIKKRNEISSHSDSSPEGSPSKSKSKSSHKLSLLATLGILRNDGTNAKNTKRKRKVKKKNETIEKLLQSKKTFMIDEPCGADENRWVQKEKTIDESVQETKNIITILKKLSDEEKKNSELSKLMANEFKKKPPLIFGGTYPIDEPFISTQTPSFPAMQKMAASDQTREQCNVDSDCDRIMKHSQSITKISRKQNVEKCKSDNSVKVKHSERESSPRMSPLQMIKKMHSSGKRFLQSKEATSSSTAASANSNTDQLDKKQFEFATQDSRQSSFDYGSNYGSTATRRERRDSAMSSASRYSAGSLSVANKTSPKEVKKTEVKKESKQNAQVGKTWLGGIFSRLLPKGPNQMILPDDKNPTIVWDDTRNCWVNKDSNDDDETCAPLAPPTDMELMGSKSSDKPVMPQGSSVLPGNSVPPGNSMHSANAMPPGNSMPPPSTVNKFQRPKTRIMRQNYVDVLNTSGSTTKSNVPPEALFPSPYENTGTPKMFIPNAAPVNEESASEFESGQGSISTSHKEPQEPTQAPLSTPLMLDPAEFDARRSNVGTNHRVTLGRTGRRTYPT